MIEIQHSVNYRYNQDHHQKPNCDPCIVCGKAVEKPKHYVRLFYGSTAVTQAEAEAIIAEEGGGGDLNYYPVGSNCLSSRPALKPYVEDAARAMAALAHDTVSPQ